MYTIPQHGIDAAMIYASRLDLIRHLRERTARIAVPVRPGRAGRGADRPALLPPPAGGRGRRRVGVFAAAAGALRRAVAGRGPAAGVGPPRPRPAGTARPAPGRGAFALPRCGRRGDRRTGV